MIKLLKQYRNWIMDRKKFTEEFCKASMTIFMLIIALLIAFLVVLTG